MYAYIIYNYILMQLLNFVGVGCVCLWGLLYIYICVFVGVLYLIVYGCVCVQYGGYLYNVCV